MARQGVYPETIAIDVDPVRLRRYFVAEPGHLRVKQELRDLVLFAPHNLLRDPPFSRLDLVTCRNVLIYLNRSVQEQILRLFHFALRPDGYLLLGTSESTEGVPDLFSPVDRGHHLFQRRTVLTTTPLHVARLPVGGPRGVSRPPGQPGDEEPRPSFAALHERLLIDESPPSILVSAEHEIVHVAAGAGKYLQFGEGSPSHNLLDLSHPDLRLELRTALFAARQDGGQTVVRRFPTKTDGRQLIELVVRPIREPESANGFFLIVLREIAEIEEFVRQVGQAGDDLEPMVRQIEDELQRTKDQLRLTVEQYETAVEEYRAANEELQALNEEAQAASEELETSKEELQSANEELTTLNQALRHSLDEARRTSNDLQNLMDATEIGTIFLDGELRIKLYTPSAQALFNVIPADINRPLVHITHRLNCDELVEDAERVRATRHAVQREVPSIDGRWYLAQLVPYRTPDETETGILLTFVDITERKQREAELERLYATERASRAEAEEAVRIRDQFLTVASHELRTPLTTLKGYASLLQRRRDADTDDGPRSRRMVATIVRQTERLSVLIEQLLDASRLQRGQFEPDRRPLDLATLVERAVDDFSMTLPANGPGPNHVIELSRPDSAVPILGDPYRLDEVLQNLLSNAVKYSPDGGQIRVRLARDATDATLEVEDQGVGISDTARQHLFEPFYRARDDNKVDVGFGIGLYVVSEIVTHHGGRIEVTGTEGIGSTFRVTLPLHDPDHAADAAE